MGGEVVYRYLCSNESVRRPVELHSSDGGAAEDEDER